MRNFLILFFSILIAGCIDSKKDSVVKESDLQNLLIDVNLRDRLSHVEDEVDFWLDKSDDTPRGYIYLQKAANASIKLYHLTGEQEYLELNKELLHQAGFMVQGKNQVNNLLNLSHAEMMLHNFSAALTYSQKADSLTTEKFGPLMMQYDAAMELGSYKWASRLLQRARQAESFDYLVRLAKYKDHMGQLDSAIYYNEQALKLVNSPEKRNWVITNLADLYGHAGLISKSYNNYLKALSHDPDDYHAIKGITWIAFSNDKNYPLAKRLCHLLVNKTSNPEYLLLYADIYEAMGQIEKTQMLRSDFIQKATSSLYNSQLIPIMAELESQKAIELALSEVNKRPTPEIFSLLAWAYFKNGEKEKALDVIEAYVYEHTHEPLAIYRMALIFHALNDSRSNALIKEVLDAEFELGPVLIQKIKKQLD